MKAVFNNVTIAESDDVVFLEGNHYFPPESLKKEYFKETDYRTSCPWKGIASYYNIEVNGEIRDHAGWTYKNPSEEAKEIKDYVAFWKGVRVINSLVITERFIKCRKKSELLCKPLITEDYSVQPVAFVSPPKWHLAHITWFWEEFLLTKHKPGYNIYNKDFSYLFNSYYNNAGSRVLRPDRGLMTRPGVEEVYKYRKYVTNAMVDLLQSNPSKEILDLLEIGINHEEQHQELLAYDIKYILGHQPGFPVYGNGFGLIAESPSADFTAVQGGIYEIGHDGDGFAFDNELGRHKVYLNDFEISNKLVTNGAYLEFIEAGGYQNFNYWHDEGWQWVKNKNISAPEYWHKVNGEWYLYNLDGLQKIDLNLPVNHISFYEAFAFADYKGMRLPTEFEWEVAADKFNWGQLWEWTNSAYLPYPKFSKAPGALGEYNGKFMINTMVLRGASVATPPGHGRNTYRNFFHPNMRWQFAGCRLVKK